MFRQLLLRGCWSCVWNDNGNMGAHGSVGDCGMSHDGLEPGGGKGKKAGLSYDHRGEHTITPTTDSGCSTILIVVDY